MNSKRDFKYSQSIQDKEYPPPTIQGHNSTAIWGLTSFAIVMFSSLFFTGFGVMVTVVSTGVVYLTIMILIVLIDSGALERIVTVALEQRTIMHADRLNQATQRITVEHPIQLPHSESVALPGPSTFVAPIAEPDDSAKREAAAWVLQLYGADGQPDPKKVLMQSDKERPGRVRVAAPSRPAKQYLLDRHIIHDLGNGFRLSLARCPTITAAQNHLV